MDNQAYETALESFSGVLEMLSAGIKKLTKTPAGCTRNSRKR